MNRTVTIVLQVLGFECVIAMITTVRIENLVVFDVPIPVRAVIGIIGMALVIVGAFGFRRTKIYEAKLETQHSKSLNPTESKAGS